MDNAELHALYEERLHAASASSFDDIRSVAVSLLMSLYDENTRNTFHRELERGVIVIDREELLWQYLYSFGLKHQRKMNAALDRIPNLKGIVERGFSVIDWGCGQGLATVCLIDYLKDRGIDARPKQTVLIEPSRLALENAKLHVKLCGINRSRKVRKRLDDVKQQDIKTTAPVTIHLFSNILDIEDFDLKRLSRLICGSATGSHVFVCVSPLIRGERNQRLEEFKSYFSGSKTYDSVSIDNDSFTAKIVIFEQDFGNRSVAQIISHRPISSEYKAGGYDDGFAPAWTDEEIWGFEYDVSSAGWTGQVADGEKGGRRKGVEKRKGEKKRKSGKRKTPSKDAERVNLYRAGKKVSPYPESASTKQESLPDARNESSSSGAALGRQTFKKAAKDDGCLVKLAAKGKLVVSPRNGKNGTLKKDFYNLGRYTDGRNATSIVIEKGVIAPESSDGLFSGFSRLTSADLSGLDTSNVRDFSGMFVGCPLLTTLKVSGWNTSHVSNMSKMFYGCSSLRSVNLSSWDTSAVLDMSKMFWECKSLISLKIAGWNTSAVTNMCEMFSGCSSLDSLDISWWDIASAENTNDAFKRCFSMKTIKAIGWKTSSAKSLYELISSCRPLRSITVDSEFNIPEAFPDAKQFLGRWRLRMSGRITSIQLKQIDRKDYSAPKHNNVMKAREDISCCSEPTYGSAWRIPIAKTSTENGLRKGEEGQEAAGRYGGTSSSSIGSKRSQSEILPHTAHEDLPKNQRDKADSRNARHLLLNRLTAIVATVSLIAYSAPEDSPFSLPVIAIGFWMPLLMGILCIAQSDPEGFRLLGGIGLLISIPLLIVRLYVGSTGPSLFITAAHFAGSIGCLLVGMNGQDKHDGEGNAVLQVVMTCVSLGFLLKAFGMLP